jgi:hypothetical protein
VLQISIVLWVSLCVADSIRVADLRERERERDLPWLLVDRVVCKREEEEEEEHQQQQQCDVLAGSLRKEKNKNKKMMMIIKWTC